MIHKAYCTIYILITMRFVLVSQRVHHFYLDKSMYNIICICIHPHIRSLQFNNNNNSPGQFAHPFFFFVKGFTPQCPLQLFHILIICVYTYITYFLIRSLSTINQRRMRTGYYMRIYIIYTCTRICSCGFFFFYIQQV